MGAEKTTTTMNSQATPTAEETALNRQNLQMMQFMDPYQKKNYAALSDNIFSILSGTTPAAKGIGGVDAAQTQEMVNASLRDVAPGMQASGLMDSGSALQAGVRASADVRNANAQFNVSAAQNLFNIAVGGQSNLQTQGTQLSSVLGNQLAGLRTQNSTSTTKGMNPFLKSFQTSLGSSLGSVKGQNTSGTLGFGGAM
jgi:hypothetical protein